MIRSVVSLLVLVSISFLNLFSQEIKIAGVYNNCGQFSVAYIDLKKNGKYEWFYEKNKIAFISKGTWKQNDAIVYLNPHLTLKTDIDSTVYKKTDKANYKYTLKVNNKSIPRGYRAKLITEDSTYVLKDEGSLSLKAPLSKYKITYFPGLETNWITPNYTKGNEVTYLVDIETPKEEIARNARIKWNNRILTVLPDNRNLFLEGLKINYRWIKKKKEALDCEYQLMTE